MSLKKGTPVLNDQSIYPSSGVLKDLMGSNYPLYETFMTAITGGDIGLIPEWRYYRDGNSWLCKITDKKKTIIWLSVWADHFRIVFYFNKKTAPGVFDLDIPQDIKDRFT